MHEEHAAEVNQGKEVARRWNMEEKTRQDGKRGEEFEVDGHQTLYTGGKEKVRVQLSGGKEEVQERSRAGLEPSAPADWAREDPVTESEVERATDEEAAAIIAEATGEAVGRRPGEEWRRLWRAGVMAMTRAGGDSYWETGGNATNGYTEVGDARIAADPVMRLFLRCDDVGR